MDHARTPSGSSATSATSTNSSYQMILEHMLQYPGSYEIPLRTMYDLNVAQAQQAAPKKRRPSSPNARTAPDPTAQFTASLMSQICRLPSQPYSLPAAFTTSYIRRCFPAELDMVSFTQALTALDYLNDLDKRRRRDVAEAFNTVGVDSRTVNVDLLASTSPECAAWVRDMLERDRKAESYFTQVYVGLRRWVRFVLPDGFAFFFLFLPMSHANSH